MTSTAMESKMSFWTQLDKNVFRPIGRTAKDAAGTAGHVWKETLPYTLGILGGAVGGPLGASAGSTIGGMVKRGHVDLGADAMNFGTGLVGGSIMSKLGGHGFLGDGGMIGRSLNSGAEDALSNSLAQTGNILNNTHIPDVTGGAFTPGSMAGVSSGGAAAPMGGLGSPSVRTGLGIADAGHSAMSGGGMGALGQGAQAVGGDSFWNGKNIMALGNVATGAMGAMNDSNKYNLQRQQYADQKALTDEQLKRQAGMDPARVQLLAALFHRLGVQQQAAA